MPTENRSSNTEMVSVPRELLTHIEAALDRHMAGHAPMRIPVDPTDSDLVRENVRTLLAQPAEQHQGEPVARYSMDQTGCEELNPDGPWVRYDDLNRDPGEVERLREENRVLQRQLGERWADVDELRAQLAEAHGLLHDLAQANREYFPEEECPPQHPGLMARYAALSASAEPSAPVKRDERAEFEACIRREWPMAPISRKRDLLPKEDPCYGDYCDEPLQRAWVGWQMRAAMERKPF